MKYFDWDAEKNERLLLDRGVRFEEVLIAIEGGYLLDIVAHPNKTKYPDQQVFIVQIEEYAYLVPFVENEERIFLKTIIPSRKATKQYLKKRNHEQ